jgi:hypothetical protein
LSRLGGVTLGAAPTGGITIAAGGSNSLTYVTTFDIPFTMTGTTTIIGPDGKPTPSTFTSTGITSSVITTTVPEPTTTATSKTPDRPSSRVTKASVAKIAVGVVVGATVLIAIAILLWYRRRRVMFMRMRRAGRDLLDAEHVNDKLNQHDTPRSVGMSTPLSYAGGSLDEMRAEGPQNVLVLSAMEQVDSPPVANPHSPDIRQRLFPSTSQESATQSQLDDIMVSSTDRHKEGNTNLHIPNSHHLDVSKAIREKVKNRSRKDRHSKVVAMPEVLTGPDPEREVIQAQQQWMLEKNAAEHVQRLADAEAAAATLATPSGTSNTASLTQVPEDYNLLKAQVMMLQQRMEEMTAATNRGRETVDELPPAYEGQRSSP